MRLGRFITELEQCDPEHPVRIEGFGYAESLDSYRGYYDQLALGWSNEPRTVAQVLADARDAVGKTFQGYKGGDYRMDEDTAVWAAQYGDATRLGIGSVERGHGEVTITTIDVNDYQGW